jgi:hypothetical protein
MTVGGKKSFVILYSCIIKHKLWIRFSIHNFSPHAKMVGQTSGSVVMGAAPASPALHQESISEWLAIKWYCRCVHGHLEITGTGAGLKPSRCIQWRLLLWEASGNGLSVHQTGGVIYDLSIQIRASASAAWNDSWT